jgi:hypothetical protein
MTQSTGPTDPLPGPSEPTTELEFPEFPDIPEGWDDED